MVIYFITPRKGRNLFLFFINLVFYGWGEPVLVLLMVFNVIFNYIGGVPKLLVFDNATGVGRKVMDPQR